MPPFNGQKHTPNSAFDPSKDNVCPSLRSMNMQDMKSPTALAGQTGNHCKLVHGDRWQHIDGNMTEVIGKNLKTDIMVNETWEVHNNLVFRVDGTTNDNRVGVHHQTNWNPRFDHFIHTRTETHDQREIIHQPTETVSWIHKFADSYYYKGTISAIYICGYGGKFEADLAETTGKLLVVQRQGFVNAWKGKEFKFTAVKNEIAGFVTRAVASRTTVAVDHVEAEPTVNAGPTAEDGVHIPI